MNTAQTHDLACAQYRSFARKMPAFYASIVATMIATAFVFWPFAPHWLALGMPTVVGILAVVRTLWWHRHCDDAVTPQQARRALETATKVLVGASVAIVAADCALFYYGDEQARFFMIFELFATAMMGFYCLLHLRRPALVIGTVVIVPCLGMLLLAQSSTATATALSALVTFIVMAVTMRGYHGDFATLVKSRAETGQLAQENMRLANMDALTGLPNRRVFFEQLRLELGRARGAGRELAVGIIDLDGFKPVNDTYGHRVGDIVLAQVAARIGQASPRISSLCRLGGDEFAFLVDGQVDDAALNAIGEAIIALVGQPIVAGSLATAVGCSVGYARFPEAAAEADILYERADYALYQAKRAGRATVVVFSDKDAENIDRHGIIEQTLRGADLEAEFYLEFQPIVDTSLGRTWAFECLARWNSPTLGAVSPGQFIPVAERAGLVAELTPVLLRKALAVARTWPEEIHISFNVSSFDVASTERTAQIVRIIHASGVAPSRIAIEITETALVNSFAQARANLELLRAFGVKLSLDDFGTGYSSLGYLHMLPLDKLKIDRTFVRDLDSNPVSRNIVRSVLTLCRDMGLICITEGVETASQLRILQQLGGTMVQGYLLARPMKEECIAEYLHSELPYASSLESLRAA